MILPIWFVAKHPNVHMKSVHILHANLYEIEVYGKCWIHTKFNPRKLNRLDRFKSGYVFRPKDYSLALVLFHD